MAEADTRLRVYSARRPYGGWLWAYEIYAPARPPGRQVIVGVAWYATWRSALARGSAELRRRLRGLHGPALALTDTSPGAGASGGTPEAQEGSCGPVHISEWLEQEASDG